MNPGQRLSSSLTHIGTLERGRRDLLSNHVLAVLQMGRSKPPLIDRSGETANRPASKGLIRSNFSRAGAYPSG
jgi:hypothetical protein